MLSKTLWASRDLNNTLEAGTNDGMKSLVKLWEKEPTFIRPSGVFAGKVYMGMFDVSDFDVELEPGELTEVTLTIKKA